MPRAWLLCAVVAVVVAVIVGAGCTKPARTKHLVFGITAEPQCLVPLFGGSSADSEVGGLLFRELVMDTGTGPQPDLAFAVPRLGIEAELTDDGRLVVDWVLTMSARWSDGVPVTSADVVAGWKIARDDTQPVTTGRELANNIESIEVKDDHRFRVTWKTAQQGFAAPRVHRLLPAHLVLDDSGAPKDLAASGFLRKPVGNGAYRLVEESAGSHLRFAVVSPAYDIPREVVVRVLPSTEALTSALLSGEIDATMPHVGLSPIDAARLVEAHGARFTAQQAPGTTWAHLDFNLDDAVLADVRVRRAFAHAIDKRRIIAAIAGDAYHVDEGFLPRHHPAAARLAPYAVDRTQAEALLDEAGVKRAGPGKMRTRADGTPWTVQLASASGQRDTERILQLVQADLQSVGVDVALDLRPFKVFFAEGAKKRRLPHLSFYAWTVDKDTTGGSLWRADRIPSEANGWAGLNLPGWKNDEVTRLLKDADATLDDAARARALMRVQQLFHDELPALSFYFRPNVVVTRAGVVGLVPTGTQTPMAASAHTWRVR